LKKFFEKMQKVLKNGLSLSEFNRAKQSFLTSATYATCDSHRKIRFVFSQLAMGYTIDQIESTLDDINSVTLEETNKVLKSVFEENATGIVQILPKNKTKVNTDS
jgi:predicted Zn-dependent peptidase